MRRSVALSAEKSSRQTKHFATNTSRTIGWMMFMKAKAVAFQITTKIGTMTITMMKARTTMIKVWFISNWVIKIRHQRGYWRWSVSKYGSTRECTGKEKDFGIDLNDALDRLSRLSAEYATGD